MFFHRLFFLILLLSVSGTPTQVQNQPRLLRISSPSRNLCSSPEPTEVTQNLIDRLEKETAAACNCNANVTDCLCLPVSSQSNCSTSCFQYGLTKMSQTLKPGYNRTILKVQRYVGQLRSLNCKPFSCHQPCNETFTANTMEFLKALQETFQKVPISNN